MQKRRERIEKWRAEKKKKEVESTEAGQDESQPKEAKKWSLEEEESDEDENGVKANGAEDGAEAEDELDPLDAYMTEVSREVRKIKGGINVKNSKVFNKNAKTEGTSIPFYKHVLFNLMLKRQRRHNNKEERPRYNDGGRKEKA